jgi:rSAM/selenodomain-associated transferase 2
MPPRVSVVVPVLADAAAAARLLAQIQPDPRVEIIIADGGSDPALTPLTARPDVRLTRSAQGRAVQMNAGAVLARGDWLLFLHADSTLPRQWLEALLAVTPDTGGGWFRFSLDDPSWQARTIELGVRLRVRLLRLPYGDQGFFVRRIVFERLGGYRPLPLMEDVEFICRLRRAVPVAELPLPLGTSARRWHRDGWARRSARNMLLLGLYFVGTPAGRLASWYMGGRNGRARSDHPS